MVSHRVRRCRPPGFWPGLREREKETSPVILDNIHRSRGFIDVGANCGIYTVLGCVMNPSVRVVAVGRVPKICAALRRNVAENQLGSRVTILNIALSDSNLTVSFHEAEDSTMGSLAVDGYRSQRGQVIEVKCRTPDSIVGELNIQPDFMKIDGVKASNILFGWRKPGSKYVSPRFVLEANPGDPVSITTQIKIILVEAYRNWLWRASFMKRGDC